MTDPIKHTVAKNTNGQRENRNNLVLKYLQKYKTYHSRASYGTLDKRVREANPDIKNWANIQLGQVVNIPMDIPKEDDTEQETTAPPTETVATTVSPSDKNEAVEEEQEQQQEEQEQQEEEAAPEPSGKPDKSGVYPVCNGAECMCDQSKEKMPALLEVISHKNVYINDKESAEKLLATTQDIGLPFQKKINTFGSCLKQPLGFGQYKPCIPNITKWDKSYQAIKIAQANNGEALLEESEGTCSLSGAVIGKITFTTHGQTQVVTAADMAEIPTELAMMLTDGLLTEEEIHALASGTFEDKKNQKKPIEDINVLTPISLSPKGDTYRINVHQKTLVFKVNKPKTLDDKEKAAVNWGVYIKKGNNTYSHHHTFVDHGDTFTFPYRTPGTYAIEAYNDTPKFDKITGKGGGFNLLDIVYQQITGLALAVDGKDRTAIRQIRPTETVTVSAKKEFPKNDLNSKHIVWEVTLDGNTIPFTRDKRAPQITIPPQNNTTTKEMVVKATFENVEKSITFNIGINDIKRISTDKDTICVLKEKETAKERHKVTFTAHYRLPYDAALGDPKPQWCWYNIGQKPDTHTAIENQNELTYTGTSEKEGEWNIEAFTQKPKGINARLKAIKSKITRAYWADKNGNSISKSGFKHTVYIHIETQALQGEKLQLNVWESQKGKDDFRKNAGIPIEIKESNGVINQAYTIPEETPGYWKENNKLEFFFTIETLDFEVEGTMQDPEAGNQYILIPTPDKKVRYLHVDKEEKIVNLKIYEAGNKLHTGIVKYGDTVTIKVTSRNLVGEELELKVRESVWGSDRKLSEIIKIKIDEEGKGEAPFTIPQGWKNYGDPCTVRKYYLEYKGQEFPRAYYVANPNKTEEENKANSNRIEALMLKVSDDLSLDKKLETENAVVLGSEPEFSKQKKLMFGNGGSCSQCQADFTYEQIKEVFPAAAKSETLAKQLVDELNLIREEYKIDTCQKKAHLIAQFGSETGFNTLVEDLKSYTAENLIKTFGYFTRNPNEAKKYVGNTKAIAERVYGLRKVDKESDIVTCVGLSKKERKTKRCNDLGNKNMADGYNFIGRGLIQLTGRYHYENINKEFQKAFPNQGDLVANPELLEQPKYAVMSAMSYWINKGLNKLANDGGYENVDKITSIINKYTDSKAKRKAHYIDAYYAFKLFNCELLTDDNSTKPDTNLKIKEGLSWAESLAITEAQLRANPNTPYIVNYKQESGSEDHLRTEQTEAGKAKMDCSELVCRYLQKIEWSTDVKYITSRGFVDYAAQHPEKFRVNDGDPQTGDVFAWKGHTGIVKSYDPATKKVVTIESISEQSYSWHKGIHFKGVVIWEYDRDKNHLKSKGSKIVRYYTPKKHYSE